MTDSRTLLLGALLIVPLLAVGIVLPSHSRALSMANAMLQHWAQGNGFQILSLERCLLFKGAFSWTSSDGQPVYRVVVRDREGRERRGHVRCGGFWLGVFADQVEVRWDD